MADTHSATTASMNSSSTKPRPIIEIAKERRISTSSKNFMEFIKDYVQLRVIPPEVIENVIRNRAKIIVHLGTPLIRYKFSLTKQAML